MKLYELLSLTQLTRRCVFNSTRSKLIASRLVVSLFWFYLAFDSRFCHPPPVCHPCQLVLIETEGGTQGGMPRWERSGRGDCPVFILVQVGNAEMRRAEAVAIARSGQ
jgi:hypothetical protein